MSINFTINSPIDVRLSLTPEVSDPALSSELSKVYNAIRQLQIYLGKYTGVAVEDPSVWSSLKPTDTILIQNLSKVYLEASENIAFGSLVNFHDVSGELQARNANASSATPRQARAFCNVASGLLTGEIGEFIVGVGLCTAISGLLLGETYYLAVSGTGQVTNVQPSSPNLQQPVGFALSTTELFFMPRIL